MSAIAGTREWLEHVEGHPQGAGEALKADVCGNRLVSEFMVGGHEAAVWLALHTQRSAIPRD